MPRRAIRSRSWACARRRESVITGTEMFHKELDEVVAGDNAGILLRGIEREDVERGQVLAKPGTVTPHTKFMAKCTC